MAEPALKRPAPVSAGSGAVATGAAGPGRGGNVAEFSVSELSGAIKRALEDGFGYVRLRGEISGYRGPHSSGHAYFALKDDRAKIDAVIWKGSFGRLRFRPEEGMEVVAQGRLTTFAGSSKYQIVIETLEPAGVGALMAILEERKRKLAAEGLFAEERKRRLPFLPKVVGIVTSPTGAVIRDMLAGFTERFPTRVVVWPVRVQGDGSALEVANAIRGFNALPVGGRLPRPDVLIVARGGGSLEDLWGFNDEIVVRAAAESEIPLISAVGHETDWTLLDLVADARAPTPTKAAEWAVPKFNELVDNTLKLEMRIRIAVRRVLQQARTHLKSASRGLPRAEDLVARPRQRFDAVEHRLGRALLANTRAHAMRQARLTARLQPRLLEVRMARAKDRLDHLSRRAAVGLGRVTTVRRMRLERVSARVTPELVRGRLARAAERVLALRERANRAIGHRVGQRRRLVEAAANMLGSLGYQNVLRRGFAVVRDGNGQTVRSTAQVKPGALLRVEVADGRIDAQALAKDAPVRERQPPASTGPAAPRPAPTAPRRVRDGGGPQGSLF